MCNGAQSSWLDTAWLLEGDREVLAERIRCDSASGRCLTRREADVPLEMGLRQLFPEQLRVDGSSTSCTHRQILVTGHRTVTLADGRKMRLVDELQCFGICQGMFRRELPGRQFEWYSLSVTEVPASPHTAKMVKRLVLSAAQ